MCRKFKCPRAEDVMCSCEAITSGPFEDVKRHVTENLEGFNLELFYQSLDAPSPYRLCVFGTCKLCGGRLCINMDLPDYLYGDGLLAVIYHHVKHLFMDAPDRFPALFHEEDRPVVRRWLEQNLCPEREKKAVQNQENLMETVRFYTIVQRQTDPDYISFPIPVVKGSYLSLELARKEMKKMITKVRESMSGLYDAEEEEKDFWEAHDSCRREDSYLQLEIKAAELTLAASEHWLKDFLEKGRPYHE